MMHWKTRKRARKLGYDRITWNIPGTADIEDNSWWALKQINDDRLLSRIGWKSITWDLWVNHYEDYSWQELELWELSSNFEVLGWNITTWGDENTEWTNRTWNELTEDEQWAADGIGYIEESWDVLPLNEYNWTCWQGQNTRTAKDDDG